MAWLNFIDRVVIPTVIFGILFGSLGGVALGCALVLRSNAALQFITRMNRYVSTREAFAPLEASRNIVPAAGHGGRRPLLGTLLAVGGALTVYLILVRLDFTRSAYVPGIDLKRWFLSGVTLEAAKWVLVAGSAFACLVGALMLLSPQRLAAFENRMNLAYSSEPLAAAADRMHTPLEPRVAANPRAAGWTIAAASLLITLAMIGLLIYRHH